LRDVSGVVWHEFIAEDTLGELAWAQQLAAAITQISRSLIQTDICEHLARSDAGRGSEHASEMPRAQLYQARDRIQSYVPVYVGFHKTRKQSPCEKHIA
jgi:hypothetical protein